MRMPIIGITARRRLLPPDDRRVPIEITPEAKKALWEFLVRDLAATGIGYSEFILHSITVWREIEARKAEEAARYESHDPLAGRDLGPCSDFAPDTLGDDANVCTTCFYHREDHPYV